MSAIKDGGPAFPSDGLAHAHGVYSTHNSGMTLRDYFAAKALSNPYTAHDGDPNKVAEWAYHVADAMLAAREAQP